MTTATLSPSAADPAARLIALVRVVLRRWPVLAVAGLIAALGIGVREGRKPRSYTSSGTFIVQGGRGGSSLSGLASQFGIAIPLGGGDGGQSPALYVDVLQSRRVLSAVAHGAFCDPCGPASPLVPFVRLMGVAEPDTTRAYDEAVRLLQQAVAGSVNPKTGIVTVSATARTPALAQQIVDQTLTATQRFNLESRQSQASAERRFTEGRLQDVAAELRAAEQRLRGFRESNRVIGMSPDLLLREDQLSREVRRYEDVYNALARNVEQSKIDELRDTPSITVLDPPSRPYTPNPRGLVFKSILAALVGGLVAAALLAWQALRRREV